MSILHSWKINCVLKIGEGDATTCINYLRVALLFKKMYLTFSNITLFISVKHRIRKGSEEVSDFIDLWGFFFHFVCIMKKTAICILLSNAGQQGL